MFETKMDTKPIDQYENELDKFGEHALPFAVRDTLNTSAFETSKRAKRTAGMAFTMRNKFTERSIQFEKTFQKSISRMESAAGSLQEYMRQQEEGFTKVKKGKHGVPVPTAFAAGQGTAMARTRPVKRINWINKLALTRRRKAAGRGEELMDTVHEAVQTGKRTVFLKDLRHPGIYKVLGGRKNTKRGWPRGARLRMLYSLDEPTITTEKHEWLEPAANMVLARQGDIYRKSIERQIQINRSFRDRG